MIVAAGPRGPLGYRLQSMEQAGSRDTFHQCLSVSGSVANILQTTLISDYRTWSWHSDGLKPFPLEK